MEPLRYIRVSYETVRDWVARFGGQFAARIHRKRLGPVGKWHLVEVVLSIKGKKHRLWLTVDANGDVLDILVQSRRHTSALKRFFRKLFRCLGQPRVLVTEKLDSYAAAKAEIALAIKRRQHKGLNNRTEASHRHTRRREKIMGRFKSQGQAQRFLSATALPSPPSSSTGNESRA